MCFSATASFAASAAIMVISVAAFRKATTTAGYVVACIPLFFSLQQAIEGLIWLALGNTELAEWKDPAMYGFLLFAQVIWPVMIPLAAWMIEPPGKNRDRIAMLLVAGTCVGLYFLWCLFFYSVTPYVLGHHIRYQLHFPGYNINLTTATYLLVTVLPALMSSVRPMYWFGALLLLSAGITAFFYKGHLISVWCFFAAVLSVETLWILKHINSLDESEEVPAVAAY